MARMFVEGRIGQLDSPREGVRKLMLELDAEAAKDGQRVVGDVEISEVDRPLIPGQVIRLEADVVPA